MKPAIILILAGVLLAGSASLARADIRSKAAREAAEYALRKFGVKVAEEGHGDPHATDHDGGRPAR